MSERTASILSNLVAMTLTLVGPRLWVLIKAFSFWAIGIYERRLLSTRTDHVQSDFPLTSSSAASVNPTPYDLPPRNLALSDRCAAIENSHSELGAALDLIRSVWNLLRAGCIELFSNNSPEDQGQTLINIRRSWKNFLRQPVDILMSLLISAALIGLFVAESSGSLLSASIVSDTTALASSSKCAPLPHGSNLSPFSRAAAYATKCYDAEHGADGCNYFYNQTISYAEKSNQTCPFLGQTCVWGRNSAVAFDTGLIDAKILGINAAKRFQFRREMLCAPLVPDGGFIRFTETDRKITFSAKSGHITGSSVRYKGVKAMIISYVLTLELYREE